MLIEDVLKLDISRDCIDEKEPFTLGVVFIEMELLEYAREELEKAKKHTKAPVKEMEILGLLYFDTGEVESAIKEFKEALKLAEEFSPISVRLYYNLGIAYEKISQLEKAIESYENAYIRDIYYKDIEEKIIQLRQLTLE